MSEPEAAGRPSSTVARTLVAVAGLLMMLPVGLLYLSSGLVVPGFYLFGLWVLFGMLVLVAVLLTRRRSWWVPAVPAAAFMLWMALLTIGEQMLGWQA